MFIDIRKLSLKTKLMILIIFLIFTLNANAKFSSDIRYIPCNILEINVLSCEDKSFKNKELVPKGQKLKKNQVLKYKGSFVKAQINSDKPGKCSKDQEIDIKRFIKYKGSGDRFFILDTHCKSLIKNNLAIKLINNFCDTPGAVFIPECFRSSIEWKNKMKIANLVKEN